MAGWKKEREYTYTSFLIFPYVQYYSVLCTIRIIQNQMIKGPSESACNIVGISSIPEKFLCETFVFCCIIYLFVSPFRQITQTIQKQREEVDTKRRKKKRRTWYVPTYSFPSLFWSSSLLLYRFHFISLASIHSSSYECVHCAAHRVDHVFVVSAAFQRIASADIAHKIGHKESLVLRAY